MNRREALVATGAVLATLHGKVVIGDQSRGLTLALDDVDAIVIRYRGQTVVVRPHELVEALAGAALQPHFPAQMSPPPATKR